MEVSLTLTAAQHAELRNHLYPGDGYEAGAIVLCGQRAGEQRHRLIVNSVHPIPYQDCTIRTGQQLTWRTEIIVPLLEQADRDNMTVVKVHSHPSGYPAFSKIDTDTDQLLLPAIQGWCEGDFLPASVIMLPDGRMLGRYLNRERQLVPLHKITIVGDDIQYWLNDEISSVPEFAASHAQAFGEGTYALLSNLSVAVIGCSGTGSPVIEQLARLGVGELLLVDPDIVEKRNLNRILNATMKDAEQGRFKVDVLGDAVERMSLGTKVRKLKQNLWHPDVVRAVAECDVVFGCMDTIDGRYLLNRIATFYSIPYFDLGVRITAESEDDDYGEITEVCGSVHYLKPGFSLMSRNVFTMDQVAAAGLARTDPEAYARQVQEKYIRGIAVHRPAVISLNMALAALGVSELLARLHPFREGPNENYDRVQISLYSMDMFTDNMPDLGSFLGDKVGKGDQKPLLGLPGL